MTFPFTFERLIMKSLYQTKAFWAGDGYNILPLLIPFQDIQRYLRKSPDKVAVLKYLPHTKNVLYDIWYVKKL